MLTGTTAWKLSNVTLINLRRYWLVRVHVTAAGRYVTRGYCRIDHAFFNLLRVDMIKTVEGLKGYYIATRQATISIVGGLDALLPDVYEVLPTFVISTLPILLLRTGRVLSLFFLFSINLRPLLKLINHQQRAVRPRQGTVLSSPPLSLRIWTPLSRPLPLSPTHKHTGGGGRVGGRGRAPRHTESIRDAGGRGTSRREMCKLANTPASCVAFVKTSSWTGPPCAIRVLTCSLLSASR